MPILSNLIVRIGASTDDFDRKVNSSLNKIKRFSSDVTSAGMALSLGFSLPLIAAGGAAIKAAADMQSLTMGLQSVMKSSTATAAEMEKLRVVAKMPGIDLEGAVRGSIRLQILGRSADSSRKVMGELANAIAIAGGGADDFKVVSQQLVQMQSLGKVTAENLNIIKERMPAMAKVMNDTWGPGAAGDPAKFFASIGLNATQVIDIVIDKMAQGERAGNGFKNSWDNLEQSAKDAAAAFGDILLPIAQKVLDDFLTPGIEKAKAMAGAFKALDQPMKDWALGLTAVATAAPLVVMVVGTIAEKAAVLAGILNKAGAGFGAVLGGVALALKSVDEALIIYEKLKETAYQFERLTGIVFSAQGDIHKFQVLIANLSENFPDLSSNIAKAYNAVNALADAVRLPGFALFKAALDAINTATAAATGRSREMDDAIGELNKRTVEQGAQNIKLAADMKNFGGAAGDLIPKIKGISDGHNAAAAATAAHTKVIYADSVAQLLEMEAVSRGASAWAIATKAVYGFVNAYQPWGDKIALHASDTGRLAMATEEYRQALDRLANVKMVDIAPRDVRRGSVLEADDILSRAGGTSSRQQSLKVAGLEADLARIKQLNKEGKATGNDVIAIQQALKKEIDGTGKAAEVAGEKQVAAMRQVSLVVNDLAKGIAKVIFGGGSKIDTLPMRRNIDELKQSEKDLLSQQKSGKDVTNQLIKVRMDLAEAEDKLTDAIKRQGKAYQALQAFKNIGLDIAQSITRAGIEYALMKISKQVLGLIGDFGNLGGIMAKVFGGGLGAAKAVPALNPVINAAGGIGGAIGSAAPAASSAIGGAVAAADPIVGMVMAVASVVSAISAVVANFQFAAMNKSLDIIVKHTLQAANDLANLRADEWTREGHLMAKLDDLWRTNLGIYDLLGKGIGGMGGGGGSTFNITVTGGDTRAVMENLTRMLKLHGAIPANA